MKTTIENLIALQTLEMEPASKNSRKIKSLREEIPTPILHYFDRFLTRGKKGIAVVRNGVCQGCHIQVPIAVVNDLAHGVTMSNCGNCGRYLYMPPDEVIAFQNRNKPSDLRVAKPVTPGLVQKTVRPSRKARASAQAG